MQQNTAVLHAEEKQMLLMCRKVSALLFASGAVRILYQAVRKNTAVKSAVFSHTQKHALKRKAFPLPSRLVKWHF